MVSAMLAAGERVSQDSLLGGRLAFAQPRQGYRAAIDPVLLAAAVPDAASALVLDAGSGAGAASLCLGWRCPDIKVVALELDRDTARMAIVNADGNAMRHRLEVVCADLAHAPLKADSVDLVMTNPPYLRAGTHRPSPIAARALAHGEGTLGLPEWLRACLRLLRSGGQIVVIQRADRLDDLLAGFGKAVGAVTIKPVQPRSDAPANRVLVKATKGTRAPLRLAVPLIMHETDGSFTRAAQALLRDGASLEW